MVKPSKKAKLPLFDVRIRCSDRDTVVLKGPPGEASPVAIAGVVALSVTEPIHVKKLDLKLYATLNMHWDEKYHNSSGQHFVRPVSFSKIVHCYEWDPIDLDGFLHTHDPLNASFISPQTTSGEVTSSSGFMSGKQTRSNPGSNTNLRNLSSSNLKELMSQSATTLQASKSSSSFGDKKKNTSFLGFGGGGSGGVGSGAEIVLQPGNYEFPFYTVMDGSAPESIVGQENCSIDYKLQARIERGRFTSPIITRRLVHVIRTLTADNSELSETVAVDNTWPGKVDYSISCPTKAIAIGSSLRVDIDLSPLAKGLKLGNIKIKLIEYSNFSTFSGNHVEEHSLTTKHLPKIERDHHGLDVWSDDREVDIDGVFFRSHNTVLSTERWEIRTFLNLPASLEKLTQDCDIGQLVKIRHKLKFSIGLINPDGHVSELRAALPITLFISPFVPIKVKPLSDYPDNFHQGAYDDASVLPKGEIKLFSVDNSTSRLAKSRRQSVTDEADEEVPVVNTDTQSLLAPPNYNDRVYDRLFDPRNINADSEGENRNQGNGAVDATNLEQSKIKDEVIKKMKFKGATFSFGDEDEDDRDNDVAHPGFNFQQNASIDQNVSSDQNVISGPAFDTGVHMPISRVGSQTNLHSPLPLLSPVQHLSRAGSFVNTPSNIPSSTDSYFTLPIEKTTNSIMNVIEPPGYDDALTSDVEPADLTPAYEGSSFGQDLTMHLDALDSRLRKIHLSRMQSADNMSTLTADAPPRLSRNSSSTHIALNANKMSSYISSKRSSTIAQETSKPPALLSRAQSSNAIIVPKSQKQYKPVLTPPKVAKMSEIHRKDKEADGVNITGLNADEFGGLEQSYALNQDAKSLGTSPNVNKKAASNHEYPVKPLLLTRKSTGFLSNFRKKL